MVKNTDNSLAILCMRCSSHLPSLTAECHCKYINHIDLFDPSFVEEEQCSEKMIN